MLAVALSAACADAGPAHADAHAGLILDGLAYPLKHFPYDLTELPKDNWLGFAYAGKRWKPIPCVLVPTGISVDEDEGYHYVFRPSHVPGEHEAGFLLHGLALAPGPFECGQLEAVGTRPGILLDDRKAPSGSSSLGTFRLGERRIEITADRSSERIRLSMRFEGRNQVLFESVPTANGYLEANLVCDIDRDGKPDVFVTVQDTRTFDGVAAKHARLFLSSRARAGELVAEVASY